MVRSQIRIKIIRVWRHHWDHIWRNIRLYLYSVIRCVKIVM